MSSVRSADDSLYKSKLSELIELIKKRFDENNGRPYDVFIRAEEVHKIFEGNSSLEEKVLREYKNKKFLTEGWSRDGQQIYAVLYDKKSEIESMKI